MRVDCTPGQLASMRHWGTARHDEYLTGQVEKRGKRRSVYMPPVAWATLANLLREEAFTKWGKGRPSKLTGDAKGTRSALHCIEKHLTAATQHPALRGYSVYGCSEQLMTVWPVGTMMLRDQWSLTPTIVGPMVVLYPEFYEGTQVRSNSAAFRADLTTWTPVPWEDHWRSLGLFPEPEHLNWQT